MDCKRTPNPASAAHAIAIARTEWNSSGTLTQVIEAALYAYCEAEYERNLRLGTTIPISAGNKSKP